MQKIAKILICYNNKSSVRGKILFLFTEILHF